jgi:hypothetical protein
VFNAIEQRAAEANVNINELWGNIGTAVVLLMKQE